MQTMQLRPVYSVPDFVREFGISRSSVYEDLKSGRLKFFKIGKHTRIAGDDAAAWLASHRAGKAA